MSLTHLANSAEELVSGAAKRMAELNAENGNLKAEIAGWNSVKSSKALRRRHGKKA
jgi:hypothetical protein